MSDLEMEFFPEDQLAINISSLLSSSPENYRSQNSSDTWYILPCSNPFDQAGGWSLEGSSCETQDAIESGVILAEESCRFFSLAEILITTNNFDDALVVGTGGFGKVYKGFIDDGGTIVAIKRLNDGSKQGAEEFWTEVKMLSKLQHTHLVALIGYCNENQEMILVYEYVARGTLANHLYKFRGEESDGCISFLTWEQRLKICVGAARGLDYLHSGTKGGIIHRDIKSTNILLDENWVAKVSDFGLCKRITSFSRTHVSTKVKGTIGYLDPDYCYTNRITKKSDVYAFGVVLLEVLCGRPPVDTRLEEEQISLILWAEQYIEKGKLDQIIDPSMRGQITPNSLKQVGQLANKCLHAQPKERPTMAEVLERLEIALASHECKRKTNGMIIRNAFQDVGLVPKGMNLCFCLLYICFSLQLLFEIRYGANKVNKGLLISRDGWSKLYKGFLNGRTLAIKGYIECIIDTWKTMTQCLRVIVKITRSCVVNEEIQRPSREEVSGSSKSALQLREDSKKLVETAVVLSMTDPGSDNVTFSLDCEYTVGGQRHLISHLVQPSTRFPE